MFRTRIISLTEQISRSDAPGTVRLLGPDSRRAARIGVRSGKFGELQFIGEDSTPLLE
jgi:hypothetical protein